jgi:hypothetical protein
MKSKRAKPFTAGKKVQFFSVAKEISDLAKQGYSRKEIYTFFKEKGVLTMSYDTFSRYINGKIKPPQEWRPPSTSEAPLESPPNSEVSEPSQHSRTQPNPIPAPQEPLRSDTGLKQKPQVFEVNDSPSKYILNKQDDYKR